LARPAFAPHDNPYTARIYRAMDRSAVKVTDWSLARALLGRWDIVHVHWPETVFDHSLPEALLTTRTLLRAVDHARRRGARLVWTVHNLHAHGERHPRAEAEFWREWITRLDGILALTEAGLDAARTAQPGLADVPSVVVPHPHYRGVYRDDASRDAARLRLGLPATAPVLAFFGRVAAYKGIPELVEAFRTLSNPDARLVIAGAPLLAEDRRRMTSWSDRDARIRTVPSFIPPDEVQDYFRAANLVVLPFREILNSGSAILSLSFDRRVLAPARGAMVELAAQTGARWVQTYDGPLTTDVLSAALAAAMTDPDRTDGSHLAPLDPTEVARQTVQAYYAFRA
jgi:glycosyltransferase involved in cell wall biosynthesis